MCEPISIGLAAAGTLASLGGTIMSSNAQASAARAIQDQNQALVTSQNQAFMERAAAGRAQTAAQLEAARTTTADRNANFTQMRQAQTNAQQRQQDILAAENQQADTLRQTGDTQAKQLLAATTGDKLRQGQADAAAAQNLLLDQNAPAGPSPTDPQGTAGDDVTAKAIARRMAQASSNVRTYGAKVADLTSYNQPIQDVGLAILANKYGIMPAQQAESLLRSGNTARLLPAQVAFRNAGDIGGATDQLLATRGQSALDTSSLIYGNQVANTNLAQNDISTLAANKAAQATQDAQFNQQIGNIISGVGQLGLYGAGRASGFTSLIGKA
jgi:hypothetical protein